jgi:hypothetical protein
MKRKSTGISSKPKRARVCRANVARKIQSAWRRYASQKARIAPYLRPLFRGRRILRELNESMNNAGVLYLDKIKYETQDILVDEIDFRIYHATQDLNELLCAYTGIFPYNRFYSVDSITEIDTMMLFTEIIEGNIGVCKAWADTMLRKIRTLDTFIQASLIEHARLIHATDDFFDAYVCIENAKQFLDDFILIPTKFVYTKTPHAVKIQALWRGYSGRKCLN